MSTARAARTRCAVWLGVVALLVQVWLPLVHHPATLFAPDGEETAAFAALVGEHALCIAATQTEQPRAPPPGKHAPDHHLPVCPICRVLHAAGAVAPPVAFLYTPHAFVFHTYGSYPKAFIATARRDRTALPRAPPQPV